MQSLFLSEIVYEDIVFSTGDTYFYIFGSGCGPTAKQVDLQNIKPKDLRSKYQSGLSVPYIHKPNRIGVPMLALDDVGFE